MTPFYSLYTNLNFVFITFYSGLEIITHIFLLRQLLLYFLSLWLVWCFLVQLQLFCPLHGFLAICKHKHKTFGYRTIIDILMQS